MGRTRKEQSEPEEEPVITYGETTESKFLPGVESQSLVESCRGELPIGNEPKSLVFLAVNQAGLYSTFLGKLIMGSSFRSAAMACGLSYRAVCNWVSQGSADLGSNLDSWCGRFLLDCQRAASLAITNAEERVFLRDPEKWLRLGPGKLFFKGEIWSDDKARALTGEEVPRIENPLDPVVDTAAEIEGEVIDDTQTMDDLADAIKVLEDHQIVTSPEFFKQAREQYKLPAPEGEKK